MKGTKTNQSGATGWKDSYMPQFIIDAADREADELDEIDELRGYKGPKRLVDRRAVARNPALHLIDPRTHINRLVDVHNRGYWNDPDMYLPSSKSRAAELERLRALKRAPPQPQVKTMTPNPAKIKHPFEQPMPLGVKVRPAVVERVASGKVVVAPSKAIENFKKSQARPVVSAHVLEMAPRKSLKNGTREYHKGAPVSMGTVQMNTPYKYRGGSGLTITHREYMGDVISTGTAFNAEAFGVIQPGDPDCFPWLSGIGGRFEKYRIKRINFEYLPTCPSSTGGSVMLGFSQNAQRSVPTTKIQMLEFEGNAKASAWLKCKMTPPTPKQTLYTVFGNNYGQAQTQNSTTSQNIVDIKTYAAGILFVACDNVSEATVGEVFMNYELELINPGIFSIPPVMGHVFNATPTASVPWGGATYAGNLGLVITDGSDLTIPIMPPGQYLFIWNALCTSAETPNINFNGAGTQLLEFNSNAAGSFTIVYGMQFTTGVAGMKLTFSGVSHLSTSGNTCSLRIAPYNLTDYT
jgi:hypothetical protein